MREGEPEISVKSYAKGSIVTRAEEGSVSSDSDGVLVVSVWLEGPGGFLGRLTATTPDGDPAVRVVSSPDELIEQVRNWLSSLI